MFDSFGVTILDDISIIESALGLIRFIANNRNHNISFRVFLDLYCMKFTSPDQNYVISLKEESEVKS